MSGRKFVGLLGGVAVLVSLYTLTQIHIPKQDTLGIILDIMLMYMNYSNFDRNFLNGK